MHGVGNETVTVFCEVSAAAMFCAPHVSRSPAPGRPSLATSFTYVLPLVSLTLGAPHAVR